MWKKLLSISEQNKLIRTASASCSFSSGDQFFFSDILLSVPLIFSLLCFKTENSHYSYFAHLSFISLAASFDNIWNSIEYVINLDNIWQYLSKTFDIWFERYLTIFNDNLAIFGGRNVHTGATKLSPKRYRQISSFIA